MNSLRDPGRKSPRCHVNTPLAVVFRKMKLICTNGKHDSETKLILVSPEYCLPFCPNRGYVSDQGREYSVSNIREQGSSPLTLVQGLGYSFAFTYINREYPGHTRRGCDGFK